jgi:hypothetical protein
MKLVLIGLALLFVLFILLIYIYRQEPFRAEPITYEPVQVTRQRRTYTYTPDIDFTLIRPTRRHKRRVYESESSEISETWTESDDTFEDIDDHIIIINGPDEIQQLVGLVQRDILNDINDMHDIDTTFQPAGLRRHRNRTDETADEFFQDMNAHNDDGQNVHNPQIRKALTDRLLRIIELNGGVRQTYEVGGLELQHDQYFQAKFTQTNREIRERAKQYHDGLVLRTEINREEADLRLCKIDMVLKKMTHGYTLIMKDNKAYKENFILVHIWDRINHADNFAHREQLQIALIDNLVDAIEERQAPIAAIEDFINTVLGTQHQPTGIEATHMTVCINGRVARILTSLVLLDADEKIAAPEKDEKEYTNEALYKAARIMERELDTYEVKLPELNTTMRTIYEDPDEDKLSQRELLVLRTFENHLKEVMAEEIHADYDGIIPPGQVTGIIEKAHAGI